MPHDRLAFLKTALNRDPLTVAPEASVRAVMAQMTAHATSCVFVVENDQLLGILTERDIVRLSAETSCLDGITLGQVMVSPKLTVRESALTDIRTTLNWFQQHQIQHLPILDECDRLIGLVTCDSLLHASEITLKESKDQFHQLTESLPGMVFQYVLHPDGREAFSGIGFQLQAICELDPEAVHQDASLMWSRVHPEDIFYLRARIDVSAQTGQPFYVEYRIVTPQRGLKWLEAIAKPKRQANGAVLWNVFVQDISDRKTIEVALAESEAKFRRLVENIPGVAYRYVLHPDGRDEFTYVSAHLRDRFALEPEAVVQDAELLWSRVNPEDIPRIKTKITLSAQDGESFHVELQMVNAEGQLQWFEVFSRPERQSNGDIIWDGVLLDIHDRKQADLALKASESQLNDVLNRVSAIIVQFRLFQDRTWEYVYYSAGAEILFGYSPQELMTDPTLWKSRVHPEDWESHVAQKLDQFLLGRSVTMEYRFFHRDGTLRWISGNGTSQWDTVSNSWIVTIVDTDISERKQQEAEHKAAEIALRQSEERYRRVVEDQAELICRFQPDGTLTFVNSAYCRYFGATETELVGTNFLNLIPEESYPFVRQHLQKLCKLTPDNPVSVIEHSVLRSDGEIVWQQWTDRALFNSDHQLVEFQATGRDVTELKVAEICLQESETRFRTLTTNLPGAVYRCLPTKPWRFIYLSDGIETLTGFAAEKVLDCQQLAHPDDLDMIERMVQLAEAERRPYSLEYRIRCADGRFKWVHEQGQGYWDEHHNCLYQDGVILDIDDMKQQETERKLAEQRLRQSEERYRLLSEISPVGIFRLDPNGRCTYMNDKLLQLVGYPREFCLEGDWLMTLHPDDRPDMAESWARFREQTEVNPYAIHQTENRQLRPDGSIIWVLGLAVAERDENGKIVGFIGTLTDISVRKHAEEQLQQLNQELESKVQERTAKLQEREQELLRATQLKDEFLANMSHELRTPLNAILGMVEGLMEGILGDLNSPQIKALQTVERSGTHLLALINDILDVSKIESGKLELDCTFTSVIEVCQSGLTFVYPQALKKEIQLTSNIPNHLPLLWLDERRFTQAVTNLLANAVKFTPEGGQVVLDVEYQPPNSASEDLGPASLKITVLDTGIGIAPNDLERLFQPFTQIDTALNRQYSGTGLGLVLVKRIVELHGGSIEVASEVGSGSCFAITIPCISPKSSSVERVHCTPPATEVQSRGPRAPYRILLVEDNAANAHTIMSYLGAKGHDLMWAQSGQEGILLAQAKKPHLILMDMQMPGMDGLEATRLIREDPELADVLIVALTALAMPGDRERCLVAGVNDYLSKPVKLKHLYDTIQSLLAV